LNEAAKHFDIGLVETLDFLLDAEANDVAERKGSPIEVKSSSALTLSGRGLVEERESEQHIFNMLDRASGRQYSMVN
jgi:hypothetical protein